MSFERESFRKMPSIAGFTAERIERVLAWARYLHWADLHRRHFYTWMESPHDVANDEDGWNFVASVSAWYASLWVVVEGWKELELDDSSIDKLLNAAPEYVDLLRRYRNGVFHYQSKLSNLAAWLLPRMIRPLAVSLDLRKREPRGFELLLRIKLSLVEIIR